MIGCHITPRAGRGHLKRTGSLIRLPLVVFFETASDVSMSVELGLSGVRSVALGTSVTNSVFSTVGCITGVECG